MMSDQSALRPEELVSARLRALYQAWGYASYKVNRFEEYDLYMRNKSFLTDDHILTFTDTDGKLMALKPDITLSVVDHANSLGYSLQLLLDVHNLELGDIHLALLAHFGDEVLVTHKGHFHKAHLGGQGSGLDGMGIYAPSGNHPLADAFCLKLGK